MSEDSNNIRKILKEIVALHKAFKTEQVNSEVLIGKLKSEIKELRQEIVNMRLSSFNS